MPEFLNAANTEDVNDVNAEFDNLFGSSAQEPEESFVSKDGHNTSFGVNKEEEVVEEITITQEVESDPF